MPDFSAEMRAIRRRRLPLGSSCSQALKFYSDDAVVQPGGVPQVPSMYYPGKREAWLAVVTLVVLAILKLSGML